MAAVQKVYENPFMETVMAAINPQTLAGIRPPEESVTTHSSGPSLRVSDNRCVVVPEILHF